MAFVETSDWARLMGGWVGEEGKEGRRGGGGGGGGAGGSTVEDTRIYRPTSTIHFVAMLSGVICTMLGSVAECWCCAVGLVSRLCVALAPFNNCLC